LGHQNSMDYASAPGNQPSMRSLLLFFIIVFSSCSSLEHTSVIGEWVPIKVTSYNAFSNATSVAYERNSQESVKEKLFKQDVSESESDSEDIEGLDTTAIRNQIDNDFLRFDAARLVFKNDSTVIVNSYGLIIPTAVPGWHFGDIIGGTWTQSKNKLKMVIRDDKVNYPFYYEIITLTRDSLVLGMTNEHYEKTYMTLAFIRH